MLCFSELIWWLRFGECFGNLCNNNLEIFFLFFVFLVFLKKLDEGSVFLRKYSLESVEDEEVCLKYLVYCEFIIGFYIN